LFFQHAGPEDEGPLTSYVLSSSLCEITLGLEVPRSAEYAFGILYPYAREVIFMLRRAALNVALVGLFLLPSHVRIVNAAPGNPLEGVWQVVDVGGQPAAGVYIFTGTHYSMMFAATNRPDIADASKATADELRAMWAPMAANAGTYEVAGDLVTIRPIVAKIPVVMKPGAYEVYAFRIQDNTLSWTQQRNVRGPVESGATTKLMRVE
jgi:hypothetical protein